MKKVVVIEIKNGLIGDKFTTTDDKFPLDLKKCGKTYISGGVKVYIDSNFFQTLKKDLTNN